MPLPGYMTLHARTGVEFEKFLPVVDLDQHGAPPVLVWPTGTTAAMQWRAAPGGTLLLNATTANGRLTLAAGGVHVVVPTAVMATLDPDDSGTVVWDLQITLPTGEDQCPWEGRVHIHQEVTSA